MSIALIHIKLRIVISNNISRNSAGFLTLRHDGVSALDSSVIGACIAGTRISSTGTAPKQIIAVDQESILAT